MGQLSHTKKKGGGGEEFEERGFTNYLGNITGFYHTSCYSKGLRRQKVSI